MSTLLEIHCQDTYTPVRYMGIYKVAVFCRFRVKIEPIKQEKFDTGIQMKYMDYIDVPASSKKDYKLSFYAYRESANSMKVGSLLILPFA